MRQRRASDQESPDSQEHQEPGLAALPAPRGPRPQRLLMPGPQLYSSLVQHREAHADLEYVLDQRLRAAARSAPPPAPRPDFTAAVRSSISQARIAPPPAPPMPPHRRALASLRDASRRAQHAVRLTDRQWRAAIGSVGTLAVALVFGGVGFALDPSEMFALLGVVGALVVSLLALGHLLSTVVGAVTGSAVLLLVGAVLYLALAAVWVRLMRHPLEA